MEVMLQRGDIFLARSQAVLGWLIRVRTSKIGEKRSKADHVGIVVGADSMREAVAVEALSKVKRDSLWGRYGASSADWVIKHRRALDAVSADSPIRLPGSGIRSRRHGGSCRPVRLRRSRCG